MILAEHAFDWETWEDDAGNIRYVSLSCGRISGYSADEFKYDPSLFDSIIVGEDRAAWVHHHEMMHILPGPYTVHFRIRTREGQVVWIEQICRQVHDKDGRIIWTEVSTRYRYNAAGEIEVVGVSRNIEERKKTKRKFCT